MPDTDACEVLIVGGGPTGLASALSLTLQGVSVRIIDDQPIRHVTARASNIHARTLELLAPLGVADRIVAYAQPIRTARFFAANGEELLRRGPSLIDSAYPPAQSLQQWQVEWMLAEQLLARGVSVEADTQLLDLEQDQSGVRATVKTPSGVTRIGSRFLVGADGARSRVRQTLDVRMEGFDYPERWIGAELSIPETDTHTEARFLFATERVAITFPLDSGLMFFATLREGEFPDAGPGAFPVDDLKRVFDDTFGRIPGLDAHVTAVPWTGFFRMHSCVVPDYRTRRVFLAGDAAHLCSAAGGFGMNAGIQDGINLAWRLAAHIRLHASESILEGYNVDRREMFAFINAASDATHRLWSRSDRDAVIRDRASMPAAGIAAADRDMGEVAFAYRNDRMWFDQGEPGVIRAGMRMPPTADMSSGDGASRPWSSLYDGLNWTFVLTVSDRIQVRAAYVRQLDMVGLSWLSARSSFVLAAGEAFAWNAPRPTLYVVRPDGYVAFRLDAEPGALPDIRTLSGWLAANFEPDLLQEDNAAP
ncbi:MAG: FAD-dependent oxidoreductase [Pseudomonadales bacterium]